MKTKSFFLLLALVAFAFTSCNKSIHPSGNITVEEYTFTGFDAVDISDAFSATVTYQPGVEGIVIEADDNIHQYIDIKVSSERLYIGIERNYNISGPATLRAFIGTGASLEGFYASGASTIELDEVLTSENVRLEASGASRISGQLEVGRLSADLSGASSIILSGSTDDANLKLSGASTLGSYDFTVQDLDIDLAGASNASLTVEQSMRIGASGASHLVYKGNPVITDIDLSGASDITHVE